MELDAVLRHVKHAGIAIGGYLVISTLVNIVADAETAQQVADEKAAAYTEEVLAADAAADERGAEVVEQTAPSITLVPEMASPAVAVIAGDPAVAPEVGPAPAPVTGLETTTSGRVVTVSWVSVPGLTYQAELVGPDGIPVSTATLVEAEWVVEGLEPAHAHLVRVRSVNPTTQAVSEWVQTLFASPGE